LFLLERVLRLGPTDPLNNAPFEVNQQ